MKKIEIKTKADYEAFIKSLHLAKLEFNADYFVKHKKVINTNKEVIGLKVPTLKSLAKQIALGGAESYLSVSKSTTYEETLLNGLVSVMVKDEKKRFSYLESYLKTIDSWSHCDCVIAEMKFLNQPQNKQKYFDYFKSLSKSKEEYQSRFGFVVLMTYYLQDAYIDDVINLCKTNTNEQYYVQMAIAWLLSYAYILYKDKTLELLRSNVLPSFVQNKAIQKCRESFRVSNADKQELLKYKK